MNSELRDRLDRWAAATACSEPIPITSDEKYEIVSMMDGMAAYHTATGKPIRVMRPEEILASLERGEFKYREHLLVIV